MEDLIDFPVSADWLHFYAHRGLTPHRPWMDSYQDPVEPEELHPPIFAKNLRVSEGTAKQRVWAEEIILRRYGEAETESQINGLLTLTEEHKDAGWWIDTRNHSLETLLGKEGRIGVEDLLLE